MKGEYIPTGSHVKMVIIYEESSHTVSIYTLNDEVFHIVSFHSNPPASPPFSLYVVYVD